MTIDISRSLCAGMPVWPGDPAVELVQLSAELPLVSQLRLGTHTGTHVDPPAHFLAGAATVDQLSLDVLMGPAWVAHIEGPDPVTATALTRADIPPATTRLLLRTDNSKRPATAFDPGYVALTPDAAQWLLARSVRLIGIDAPSIELFETSGDPAHRLLLAGRVVIVEGLLLTDVAPGAYELICLPLLISGGDGAPARVVLRRPA